MKFPEMGIRFKIALALGTLFLFACSLLSPQATPTAGGGLPATPPAAAATLPPAATQPQPAILPTALLPPTETPPPTDTPLPAVIRFAVIGDYGLGEQAEEDVANLVKSWNPDFIITTGDNNYPSGAAGTIDDRIGRFYSEFIYPYQGAFGPGGDKLRFFPTLGNHDWDTAQAQPYLDYFVLPGNERYYDFVWGPVHFFALDSDSREPDGVGRSRPQAQWLQERLAASTSPWKLVYMHHPPYSSGLHGPVDWMAWPFREWGASAVLAGHDHLYERLIVDGLPYFINGLGGGPIYYFVTVFPGSVVRYAADYGAQLVTADAQQITFQFITRRGEVMDIYEIRK